MVHHFVYLACAGTQADGRKCPHVVGLRCEVRLAIRQRDGVEGAATGHDGLPLGPAESLQSTAKK